MLNFQYLGHLMQRIDSLEKTLMPGKVEVRRRRGRQRMKSWMVSLTLWTWVWAIPGVGDGQGSLACCSPWGHKESYMTEWLNWFICNSRSTWIIIQNLDFFPPGNLAQNIGKLCLYLYLVKSLIAVSLMTTQKFCYFLYILNPLTLPCIFFPYSYVFIFLLSFWRSAPLSKYFLSSSISLHSKHCSELKSQGKEKSVKSTFNSYLLFVSCLDIGNLFKDF